MGLLRRPTMQSRIKSLTIITFEARNVTYSVGETHNGLKIHEIREESIEFPDMLYVEFSGYTENDQRVFEAINAPLHVQFESVEE
jgi:hypothetical protein